MTELIAWRHSLAAIVALSLLGESAIVGAGPVSRTRVADPVRAAESAALFVGVREFPADAALTKVQFAVDDVIDLAHLVAIERTPKLVEPHAVVLALSGEPQKPQSQLRLKELLAAGAMRRGAGQTEILTLLEQQSKRVGRNGLLLAAFATHGVSIEGTQYLLTASSLLQHRETSLTETKIRDIAARFEVPRALILIDACRQQLTLDTRAGDADPRAAAALLRELGAISGHVVFSAAAAGEYAYDDEARGNGVFTAAVLDGLRCEAPVSTNGFVTVDTLSSFVEERVSSWIRRNRKGDLTRATQLHCEGRSKAMPLASCAVNGTSAASSTPAK